MRRSGIRAITYLGRVSEARHRMGRGDSTPGDSGYAWVILFSCSCLYMMLSGITKSYGILYTVLLDKYDAGAGNTAWIFSVKMFLFFALGPLANHLSAVFSFRKVVITGGLFISLGYFVSAFVPRMEWMYGTIGIVSGIGCGLVYSPCATIVSFYFEKRRAFANGIVISGSGIGSFIFPYIYRSILDEYGLQGALMIISAISLNICVVGALLKQPHQLLQLKQRPDTDEKEETTQLQKSDNKSATHTLRRKQRFVIDFNLFRIPRFSVYVAAFTINIIGYSSNMSVFPAHVDSLGFGEQDVAIALSMMGATEIFSRSFFGWFADRKFVEKRTILIFSSAVSGIAAIFIPFLRNYPAMIVYGCVLGIFPGAFWSLMAVMMLDCVKLERLTSAMGLLALFMSFGIIISQPMMGWIEDVTGSWDLSFRIMGMFNLLSGITLLLEPVLTKIRCCDKDADDSDIVEVERCNIQPNRTNDTKEMIHVKDNVSLLVSEVQPLTESIAQNGHIANKSELITEKMAPIVSMNML